MNTFEDFLTEAGRWAEHFERWSISEQLTYPAKLRNSLKAQTLRRMLGDMEARNEK